MKNLLYFVLLLAFVACNKDDHVRSDSKNSKLTTRSYEDIGDVHNDILEFGYSEFDTTGFASENEFLDSVREEVVLDNLQEEYISSNTSSLWQFYKYYTLHDTFRHYYLSDTLANNRAYLLSNGIINSIENAVIGRLVYCISLRFNNTINNSALVDSIEVIRQAWVNISDTMETETPLLEFVTLIGESSTVFWTDKSFLNDVGEPTQDWAHDAAGALLGATWSAVKQYRQSGSIDVGELAEETLVGAVCGSLGPVIRSGWLKWR